MEKLWKQTVCFSSAIQTQSSSAALVLLFFCGGLSKGAPTPPLLFGREIATNICYFKWPFSNFSGTHTIYKIINSKQGSGEYFCAVTTSPDLQFKPVFYCSTLEDCGFVRWTECGWHIHQNLQKISFFASPTIFLLFSLFKQEINSIFKKREEHWEQFIFQFLMLLNLFADLLAQNIFQCVIFTIIKKIKMNAIGAIFEPKLILRKFLQIKVTHFSIKLFF